MTTLQAYSRATASHHRERLVKMLNLAAELEHSLLCTYLYAAFSIKDEADDASLGAEGAALCKKWKKSIKNVAVDEMDHLAQVTNLLMAIGGAPHFDRLPFPQRATAYPLRMPLTLLPFTLTAAERFACYETPEEGILEGDQANEYKELRAHHAVALTHEHGNTVADFYRLIEAEMAAVPEELLFIGRRADQGRPSAMDLRGDLIKVVDMQTAEAAITRIIEQGEACPAVHEDSHFFVFDRILHEYRLEDEQGLIPFRAGPDVYKGHKEVARTEMLFDDAYSILLALLERVFLHTEETTEESKHLMMTGLGLMGRVISPLGETIMKMGGSPNFHIHNLRMLPHKRAAWLVLKERLAAAAESASSLMETEQTKPVAQAILELAGDF